MGEQADQTDLWENDLSERPSTNGKNMQLFWIQNNKVVTVYYHGQASSFQVPRTVKVVDIKRYMSVRLSVPVEKLALRIPSNPPELEMI